MGKIEAVYHGIITRDSFPSEEEMTKEQDGWEDAFTVVAKAIVHDFHPDSEEFEEEEWQKIKRSASPLGKLVLLLPSRRRRFSELHDQLEAVVYMNPAREAVHMLVDTAADLALGSETAHVSCDPEELVEACLEGNYDEDFVEDSGMEVEYLPRILTTTARCLAATAFRLSRVRSIDEKAALFGRFPYDDKLFEIYSVPEAM